MRIGIDARMAAEVPAGRGRYLREVLRRLPQMLGDGAQLVLYARRPWDGVAQGDSVRWRIVESGRVPWPLAAGRAMRGECDVVLATSSYLLCAVAPLPVLSIAWDLSPFHRELQPPRGSGFERATLPLAVRRCAGWVAISAATRDELAARYPWVRGHTLIAHPAAGPEFTPRAAGGDATVAEGNGGRRAAAGDDEAALERLGVSRPYVLATGTLEPRKNLPRLIGAFASLPAAVREGRRLLLAGAPGWETHETFARCAAHAGFVDTLGFVPDADLPALYRGADLFCYPSLYEGFGIPLLEAMACGTPVLTSGVSSMPEVGGDAALYVDPREERDIARGLGELLTDAELRGRLAVAGPLRAATFDWAESARVLLSALTDAAS